MASAECCELRAGFALAFSSVNLAVVVERSVAVCGWVFRVHGVARGLSGVPIPATCPRCLRSQTPHQICAPTLPVACAGLPVCTVIVPCGGDSGFYGGACSVSMSYGGQLPFRGTCKFVCCLCCILPRELSQFWSSQQIAPTWDWLLSGCTHSWKSPGMCFLAFSFIDLWHCRCSAEDFWHGYKLFCYAFYSHSEPHEAEFRATKLGAFFELHRFRLSFPVVFALRRGPVACCVCELQLTCCSRSCREAGVATTFTSTWSLSSRHPSDLHGAPAPGRNAL